MTRYARGSQGTHRKPQEATPWKELKPKTEKKLHLTLKTKRTSKGQELKVSVKSKDVTTETTGADYRRSKKKRKVPQWKKTEWQMIESGKEETRGVAAALMKKDVDDQNPTRYRPKEVKQKASTSIGDRLKAIQHSAGEFSKDQLKDVTELLQKDDRRENRRLKRVEERNNSKTCFLCRKSGHEMMDCPKAKKDMEQGSGICFKCGSLEHSMHTCQVKVAPGELPYAKCFICGESGHLSKQCPDNPRGLYPNGGCCRTCSSVEHYNKDCPAKLKAQGIEDIKVSRVQLGESADLEESFIKEKKHVMKRKPKVVKF